MKKKNKLVYIIAEVGINHNGKLENCLKLIREAAKAGVSAVKFQNWKAEDFISDKKQKFKYKSRGKFVTESFYDLCKRNELKEKWIKKLNSYCKTVGVDFMSTPTTKEGVDELYKLKTKYVKNGSDYLTNIQLIKHMAKKFNKLIISTGMAYEEDIALAMKAIHSVRKKNKIILLHCTSMYPTTLENINLNRMVSIHKRFKTEIGFSDHTLGWQAAVQAVTLGASYIEKHITLNHDMKGPDHWFSLNIKELKEYVTKIRDAEKSLGISNIIPAKGELKYLREQRLSCVANQNISKGAILKEHMIEFKKPGTGIKPNKINKFLGKKLKKNIKLNEVLKNRYF
jgi:N,N'-diacetyllegionaminate synthase